MVSLVVVSTDAAGKTAVCSGIARKLIEKGKKPGYFRPVTLSESAAPDYQDGLTMKEALETAEAVEALCPIHLTKPQLAQSLGEKAAGFDGKVTGAFAAVAAGKDVMVIEGLSATDDTATKANARFMDLLAARALFVVRYAPGLSAKLAAARAWGARFLGIVVIGVPQARLAKITQELKDSFARDGVKVFGVVPEDRTLLGISVAEIVKALDARVVVGNGKLEGTIQNVMIGALTPDSGIDYFQRKDHKAAVLRGDRPDMALAALQTSNACLILTGGVNPPDVVVLEAQAKKTPVLVANQDTPATVAVIEKALPQAKFRGQEKIYRMDDILAKAFDFDALFKDLGA